MAEYRISGVWKSGGVITHYAVHKADGSKDTVDLPTKESKADTIKLVNMREHTVTTMVWNYQHVGWYIGEEVTVVTEGNNKYLRSNPDNKLTDNLGHLIDYSFTMP